jgi:hypothetical protein
VSAQGSDLLRLLGAAAPAQARPAGGPQRPGMAGADFAMLLERASKGELSTGRPVTVAKGAGLKLSEEQLRRIAAAADRAEAIGASRALVLIDGKAITLDIASREVTGQVDPSAGSLLNGVDAVIGVPAPATLQGAGATPASILPLPRQGAIGNPSLLRALSPATR